MKRFNPVLLTILPALLALAGCGSDETKLSKDEEKAFRGTKPPADYIQKAQADWAAKNKPTNMPDQLKQGTGGQ
jgi:ABC-type glycerol-3-phosphate transport system substrate-binding protein